jgi:hypothetical protein
MSKAIAENVQLPKLPGAFSCLTLNAVEIYTLVKQDGGVKKLSKMVLEASFQEFIAKEGIETNTDRHAVVMIVQELVECLLLKTSEQLNAFGSVASKMILLLLDSGAKNKDRSEKKQDENDKKDTDIVHKLLKSLIVLGIDSKDNINVRRAIISLENCFSMISEREDIDIDFMQYIFVFLKIVTADLKILQACIKRFTNLFDGDPETGKNDEEQLIIRLQNVLVNLVKVVLSFSLLNFMNFVLTKITKIESEDFFDVSFIEKHEEAFFKFVEIIHKSHDGRNSEIERAGENIINIFVNDSVKKLDGMAKNSQSQKAYKSKIEDMVQPLGKEISKTAGNILHQIIEDTTSVKNVKNRTNKLPGGRSGDILTFLKSILSHVLKIISDDTINAEIAKAAYNKFIDWINLHKSYDFIEPEVTIFKKMFKSLAKFVSGKAVETEENNNIVEIEKEIKNTIFKFFLNMVFGNEKEGHKYINKYFIKLIMSFDIVQWFIKPIAANNKMSLFKKEDVEDLFKPLIEIVKVELYSNLCDEQIKNEQKDRLENIKNKTKDVFEKLQKNIDLIQTSFQYASFNNSRSLHFFLGAWPVVGIWFTAMG